MKKALANPVVLLWFVISFIVLILMNLVGFASLFSKLSNSPLLWVFFIIGILILLKMFKK